MKVTALYRAPLILAVLLALATRAGAEELTTPDALAELSLEDLANVEVTSVSRRPERHLAAAAAVFVISAEDIRRSGVTSIPEALRMAPGLEVARVDMNKWAIGVRGFGSRLARSVLVLIDGRSVYNPLFAGTYWEVQDTLLEDVARIEVIRGPGGALWGANAFNGVINIITKSARDTQGVMATASAGTQERGHVAARVGGQVGERFHYRVYGKYFDRDEGAARPGVTPFDQWRMGQAGTRADWEVGPADTVTLQGDLYATMAGQRVDVTVLDPLSSRTVTDDSEISGGNVLGRWDHRFSDRSASSLQLYYDRFNRQDPHFEEHRDTVDIDLDHRFGPFLRQQLVWGLEYRMTAGRTSAVPSIAFDPANRTDHLFSAFLNDEIAVIEDHLRLILGTKVEHNDFTGFEVQPTVRVAMNPSDQHLLWASWSRAVRTPSPTEHDLRLDRIADPATSTLARLVGSRDFDAEVVQATELGYRAHPLPELGLYTTTFYNRYTRLLSIETGMPVTEMGPSGPRAVVPLVLANGLRGRSYGGEAGAQWRAASWLQLEGFYSHLRLELENRPGSNDANTAANTEGSSPRHQVSVRAGFQLPRRMELDLFARYVHDLPAQGVNEYVNLDVRLAWAPTRDRELAIVGQNLLQERRSEFAARSPNSTRVQRGVYGKVTWRW